MTRLAYLKRQMERRPKPSILSDPFVTDPYCLERWPEAHNFGYDPRCCRFPKSCSAEMRKSDLDKRIYIPNTTPDPITLGLRK